MKITMPDEKTLAADMEAANRIAREELTLIIDVKKDCKEKSKSYSERLSYSLGDLIKKAMAMQEAI